MQALMKKTVEVLRAEGLEATGTVEHARLNPKFWKLPKIGARI